MQQLDPDELAEIVVQTVESAMGPVLQRIAAAEARLLALADVRDRVVSIEAKRDAAPVITSSDLVLAREQTAESIRRWVEVEFAKGAPAVDIATELETALGPAVTRIATIEVRLGDVRDRVIALESKSDQPSVDGLMKAMTDGLASIKSSVAAIDVKGDAAGALEDMKARLGAVESVAFELRERVTVLDRRVGDLPATKDYADLRERVAVAEVFSRQPGPQGPAGKDGLNGKDGRDGLNGKDGVDGLSGKDGRDGIDGQAGPNGKDGTHGKDGLDGRDGLGFEDMDAALDGRTLVLKFSRGSLNKTFPLVLPFLRYQGVFTEGKQYTSGDVVTWGGSTWTCMEDTTAKPGDGSRVWTLCVKKGRDGKDGKDAPSLPVIRIGPGGAGGTGTGGTYGT